MIDPTPQDQWRRPTLGDERIVAATLRWVVDVVVGLQLCPFAQRELARDSLRCTVTRATGERALLADLDKELALLDGDPALATTLLVHPDVLQDFLSANAFLGRVRKLLRRSGREGVYQVVGFHPDFEFAHNAADAAGNWVNRSPWPMLHILREDSISAAVDAHPDAQGIPERNHTTLEQMGVARLKALLAGCRAGAG